MYRTLRAASILLNGAFRWSRFWAPDQTLCRHAAIARLSDVWAACLFCRAIDLVHRGHCDWSLKP